MVWYELKSDRSKGREQIYCYYQQLSQYGFPIREISFVISGIVVKNGIVNSKRVDN